MIDHHSIRIKAASSSVFIEMLSWGESAWWPAKSPMRYTRLTEGEVTVGTRYHQKVHVPFGPEWDVEVTSVTPDREVSRKFLNGMFRGVERLYIIPGRADCEVHFLMDFEVVGAVNRLLWRLIFRNKHDENLRSILSALKSHLEGGPGEGEVEDYPDSPSSAERRRFLRGIFRR